MQSIDILVKRQISHHYLYRVIILDLCFSGTIFLFQIAFGFSNFFILVIGVAKFLLITAIYLLVFSLKFSI